MTDKPEACECCGADGEDVQECFGYPLILSEKTGTWLCWECLETNDYDHWLEAGGQPHGGDE